jgi:hypothetical protein
MFKYGGPIKEGVMHGMRNGGRAALVGNPVYPQTGGREQHNIVKTIFGIGAKPVLAGAGKKTVGSVITQKATPFFQKVKELFTGTKVPLPKLPAGGTGTTTGQIVPYGTGMSMGTRTAFAPMGTAVGSNPWLYGGAQRILTPVTGGLATAGKYGWGKVKPYTGAITIAGVTYSLLKPDGTPKPLKELKDETGASEKELSTAVNEATKEEVAAAAKKARTEKLSKYLDMMGYDRSKKTAMSDALIDASAIVQAGTEEGGSLKHADWSKMINAAIQTTSKRFDKPEQIREAVGLMMTKGAIEKDIADAKGTALDIQEKYWEGKIGEAGAERKMLGKPTSLAEAVNITKATDSKTDRTAQALRHYFDGHLVPSFKSKLSTKKIKDLGGIDIFKQGAEIALGNGVYQVSNSYIIVQGNKIIQLADVFEGD